MNLNSRNTCKNNKKDICWTRPNLVNNRKEIINKSAQEVADNFIIKTDYQLPIFFGEGVLNLIGNKKLLI